MLVAIAVFAIGHPSGQKLSNQASRKFGLGGRGGSSSSNYDVDSSSGGATDGAEEVTPEETMSEEDREEIAAEEAEEAQEEAAEEAAEMGVKTMQLKRCNRRIWIPWPDGPRWECRGVMERVAPAKVIPGLELHDRYDDAFYTKPAGTLKRTRIKCNTRWSKKRNTKTRRRSCRCEGRFKRRVEELKEEIIEKGRGRMAAEEGVEVSDEGQTEDREVGGRARRRRGCCRRLPIRKAKKTSEACWKQRKAESLVRR